MQRNRFIYTINTDTVDAKNDGSDSSVFDI